jgi:VanZ family protein
MAEYTVLAFLWIRALSSQSITRQRLARWTVGVIFLTALIDESIQYFVPTRTFAFCDLCMDVAGGALAVTVFRKNFWRKEHGSI